MRETAQYPIETQQLQIWVKRFTREYTAEIPSSTFVPSLPSAVKKKWRKQHPTENRKQDKDLSISFLGQNEDKAQPRWAPGHDEQGLQGRGLLRSRGPHHQLSSPATHSHTHWPGDSSSTPPFPLPF
jgi:hypothetical protein